MIRVPHHRFNHKGGQLQFGPDGMLYAGFGDGGGGGDPDENAQNLGRMLGKLIRIDPRAGGGYSMPRDNPFRGPRRAPCREIYAYGLRNPYRFSFDRAHGQPRRSATSARTRSRRSTTSRAARAGGRRAAATTSAGTSSRAAAATRRAARRAHIPPVLTHTHDDGFCSIIGGYVIRDRSLGRGWTALRLRRLLQAARCGWRRLRRPSAPLAALRGSGLHLVSFGEDGRGRVYAISLDGPVYRLAAR